MRVAGRYQDAGSVETIGSREQRLNVQIRLADGMAEESNRGSIARNPAVPLDYQGRTLADSVTQFSGPAVAVHTFADPVRRLQIPFSRGAKRASLNGLLDRWPLNN
jgi:hypothetical protein